MRALVLALLCVGCRPAEPPPPAISAADARAAGERLAALLPSRLSQLVAAGPARVDVTEGPRIRAVRDFRGGGRTAEVELETGDVRSSMRVIGEEAEHAFGSDSPTYWRTVRVRGRRARIAERRDRLGSSEAWIRVGAQVAARVQVAPAAAAGESAKLAEGLDLDAIERAGVPGPALEQRR